MLVKRSNPDQFQLRLPPGLREQLKTRADANGRSLNSEIVFRLEEFEKMRVDRTERERLLEREVRLPISMEFWRGDSDTDLAADQIAIWLNIMAKHIADAVSGKTVSKEVIKEEIRTMTSPPTTEDKK